MPRGLLGTAVDLRIRGYPAPITSGGVPADGASRLWRQDELEPIRRMIATVERMDTPSRLLAPADEDVVSGRGRSGRTRTW